MGTLVPLELVRYLRSKRVEVVIAVSNKTTEFLTAKLGFSKGGITGVDRLFQDGAFENWYLTL